MAKQVDFKKALSKQLNSTEKAQEPTIERERTPNGFTVPVKEKKKSSQAKNNFPFYIDKYGADKLLELARESGLTRNELLIAMVNKCLSDLDIEWKVK